MPLPIEVLVVEDDLRVAEIHRRFAEKVGNFKVVATATTGEEAKEWIEVFHPQLILLDIYLPDMKGIDLIRYIRGQDHDIDIILITAASEVDIVRGALHGGVFDFIVKPLMFERFQKSLENYKRHIVQFHSTSVLRPGQINDLWNSGERHFDQSVNRLDIPKGIDQLTLGRVIKFIAMVKSEGITAEGLSSHIGVSRSTARRYLEYLVADKQIYTELIYGTVGRPERRYFRRRS